MAPLDRALALTQMNDVALRVAEDLELDVARLDDQPLQQQPRIAEGRLRLTSRRS